jgi:hypothetical protein
MQVLIIHDTESRIVGGVTPIIISDFNKFKDEVYTSWVSFNSIYKNLEGYSIIDFVDFHNLNSNMEIDWVVSDYIQL